MRNVVIIFANIYVILGKEKPPVEYYQGGYDSTHWSLQVNSKGKEARFFIGFLIFSSKDDEYGFVLSNLQI